MIIDVFDSFRKFRCLVEALSKLVIDFLRSRDYLAYISSRTAFSGL